MVLEVDPITLRPCRKRFLLYRNGTHIVYDAESLFLYIEKSGDTRDPVARQTLLSHEKMRLERVCGNRLPTEERLHSSFSLEVERRELVSALTNEVLESTDQEGAPSIDAIEYLRSISTQDEMSNLLSALRRRGIG